MDTMQVVRQGADDAAVDSGTPWRLYVFDDDFAFAETDDTDEAADLDVFVDMPGTCTAEEVRASDLPRVESAWAAADSGGAANDDAANDDDER